MNVHLRTAVAVMQICAFILSSKRSGFFFFHPWFRIGPVVLSREAGSVVVEGGSGRR